MESAIVFKTNTFSFVAPALMLADTAPSMSYQSFSRKIVSSVGTVLITSSCLYSLITTTIGQLSNVLFIVELYNALFTSFTT